MSNIHDEEALGKAYDSQLLRRLFEYLRPYRWRVLIALAFVAIYFFKAPFPLIILGAGLIGSKGSICREVRCAPVVCEVTGRVVEPGASPRSTQATSAGMNWTVVAGSPSTGCPQGQ